MSYAGLANAIHQSSPVAAGIAIAVLAAGFAYCFWRVWRNAGIVRLIDNTPTIKIRSAHQGYVEIEALSKPIDDQPVIAKLSGLPCVWYRYRIEEDITGGGDQRRWEIVDKGESTELFWLQDETGHVAVDPAGAEITPRHKETWKSRATVSGVAYPQNVAAFLAAHANGHTYRFTEERIHSGEHMNAIGLLKNVISQSHMPTEEEDMLMRLSDWKQKQPALAKRFILNHDEKIDEREWILNRAQAIREVMKSRRDEIHHAADGLNILGATRNHQRPYLLSAFTQDELAKRYRRWAAFYAAGCFLLGWATVWVFNAKFV
jgi:hypothetical protein